MFTGLQLLEGEILVCVRLDFVLSKHRGRITPNTEQILAKNIEMDGGHEPQFVTQLKTPTEL